MVISKYSLSMLPLLIVILVIAVPFASADNCPSWKNHTFRQLHSNETFNLCEQFPNQPLLIINTASHCGFTPQFSGLEKLYQRYKDQGLAVVGFASNDFRQGAKSEAEAAEICFYNFGVSFTMAAPISVTGDSAHPLFVRLAEATQAPGWNFNKYLVSRDGEQIQHFGSTTEPNSRLLNRKITALITP